VAEIVATDEWAEFKASRGAEVVSMPSDELVAYMEASDEALGETIKAVGLAK